MTPIILMIFIVLLVVIFLVTMLGVSILDKQRQKRVVGMLNTLSGKSNEKVKHKRTSIERQLPSTSAVDRIAGYIKPMSVVQGIVQRAGLDWTNSQFLGMSVGAGLGGAILGMYLKVAWLPMSGRMAVLGALFALIPFFVLKFKAGQRMKKFEEQFPDALDFLARSMRAGNAFSVSLEMLSQEAADPVGIEIRRVYNEQNLGASLESALRNLTTRVPLIDVRFFTSAVLLQRETGGNLSEILTNLAYIIRERFKLKGMVNAVSAQGRLTAWVLILLPLGLAIMLTLVAPEYLDTMVNDPDGKWIILGIIIAQVVGYYVMQKIIDIKV